MVEQNFWEMLRAKHDSLTKSGTIVADYLVQHAEDAQYLSFSIYKAAFLWRAAFLFLLSAKFADLICAFLTFCRWYGILFINEVIPWTTFPSLKRQKGGICRNVR